MTNKRIDWDSGLGETVIRLRCNGLTISVIAKSVGVSENSIDRFFARQRDLEKRPPNYISTEAPEMKRLEPFWNQKTDRNLTDLWAGNLSTAAIGREMGISKNSVTGRAHRLGLPARPSPIKTFGSTFPVKAKCAPNLTLVSVHVEPEAPIITAPAPKRVQPCGECQWPIGHPRTVEFRFCGDAVCKPGRPYCETHFKEAYVKHGDYAPSPESLKIKPSGGTTWERR